MNGVSYLRLGLVLCFALLWLPFSSNAQEEEILNRIADRSRESRSDSVLITRDGRVIFEYRSQPDWEEIDLLSATQSIASLAIGMLIDDGKIALDQPVFHFFPEWNQGCKKEITIRHLLANTSGLQSDFLKDELYRFKNLVQFALCAELSSFPGQNHVSNPKALHLLSGIVQKVTGKNLGEFLNCRLFAPLGIRHVSWLCDGVGTNFFHSHLTLSAPDLVKIGELLARGGCHRGEQLISKRWIDVMTMASQPMDPFSGFIWQLNYYSTSCWWDDELLDQYECCGVDAEFIKRLRGLSFRAIPVENTVCGTPFNQEIVDLFEGKENTGIFCQQVGQCQLPNARWKVGSLKSYATAGNTAQQMIIFPEKKVVAVRLIRHRECDDKVDLFCDFGALIEKLIYGMEP